MAEEIKNTEKTNEQTPANTAAADTQKILADTHETASAHFKTSQQSTNESYQAIRQNAERAADMIKNLHHTIEASTPEGATAEVMRSDNKKAMQAKKDINKEDPLAAYTGYSAYAVPQQDTKNEHRNYYENPLTYDEYSVSENKKGLDVKYNLTELTLGGQAKATNNPNLISGNHTSKQSFSYNEKTSGNKTIVTTEYILSGEQTPSSNDIAEKRFQNTGFQNKRNNTYVYDQDKKLIEETIHAEADNIISDSHSQAHKGQDMSNGYFKTATEVTAIRDEYTRFSQAELSLDGQEQKVLSARKDKSSETYSYRQGESSHEASYHKNNKGEWIYEGTISKIQDNKVVSSQKLSPALAQKEYNKLKQKCNQELEELTGAKNLDEYTSLLGSPKPQINLGAMWNDVNLTPADKAKAEQANAELTGKYTNIPAAIVATKRKER
ncbi:MAG: hypothetical protein J6C85_02915 [Alphaproteobacteria bacterium]|nr:hypothetical protein [Alphaproteobacteria bacterium]